VIGAVDWSMAPDGAHGWLYVDGHAHWVARCEVATTTLNDLSPMRSDGVTLIAGAPLFFVPAEQYLEVWR